MARYASQGVGEQMFLIETIQHVGDQGFTGGTGPRAREHMPAGIPAPQVADVSPAQIIAAGLEKILAKFPKGGKGFFGLGRGAIRVFPIPAVLQTLAVEQAHALSPSTRIGILNPFAQQVGDIIIGAIGLALVDIGRSVVEVLGAGGDFDIVSCTKDSVCAWINKGFEVVAGVPESINTLTQDVVEGSEFSISARGLEVNDRCAGDAELALIGSPQGVGRIEGDVNLGALATFVDHIQAMIKELSKQNLPTRDAGVTGQNRQVSNEVFLEVSACAIQVHGAVFVVITFDEFAGVDIRDLIDRVIGVGGSTRESVHPGECREFIQRGVIVVGCSYKG